MKKVFKVFRENNNNVVEDELNDFFKNKKLTILHMNTVVETVDNISYLSIVVCYEND